HRLAHDLADGLFKDALDGADALGIFAAFLLVTPRDCNPWASRIRRFFPIVKINALLLLPAVKMRAVVRDREFEARHEGNGTFSAAAFVLFRLALRRQTRTPDSAWWSVASRRIHTAGIHGAGWAQA